MKPSESNKDPLFKYFDDLGVERPTEALARNVMQSIKSTKKEIVYEPVISPFAMRIIITVLGIMFFGIIYLAPSVKLGYLDSLSSFSLPKFSLYLPSLKVGSLPILTNLSLLSFGVLTLLGLIIHQKHLKKIT